MTKQERIEELKKELKEVTEKWKLMSIAQLRDTRIGREITRKKMDFTIRLKALLNPMTKQQFNQESAHWKIQAKRANKALKELEKEYIKDNAPYPIDTKLKIDDIGKERIVVVKSYDIGETGLLTPVYVTPKGKHVFTDSPVIIKVIEN